MVPPHNDTQTSYHCNLVEDNGEVVDKAIEAVDGVVGTMDNERNQVDDLQW